MYINLVTTKGGVIVAGFLSSEKAQKLADTSSDYVVVTVHVQDAQSYPVRA